jgi:hypothetical protein
MLLAPGVTATAGVSRTKVVTVTVVVPVVDAKFASPL